MHAATYGVRSAKREFEKKLADEISEPKEFLELCEIENHRKEGYQWSRQRRWNSHPEWWGESQHSFSTISLQVYSQEYPWSGDEIWWHTSPNRTGPGVDGVHPRLLNETAERRPIAEPLTVIFNKSLQEGKVPAAWKVAHVTAIYRKKGKLYFSGKLQTCLFV